MIPAECLPGARVKHWVGEFATVVEPGFVVIPYSTPNGIHRVSVRPDSGKGVVQWGIRYCTVIDSE